MVTVFLELIENLLLFSGVSKGDLWCYRLYVFCEKYLTVIITMVLLPIRLRKIPMVTTRNGLSHGAPKTEKGTPHWNIMLILS